MLNSNPAMLHKEKGKEQSQRRKERQKAQNNKPCRSRATSCENEVSITRLKPKTCKKEFDQIRKEQLQKPYLKKLSRQYHENSNLQQFDRTYARNS